jgi:hypothetical protein
MICVVDCVVDCSVKEKLEVKALCTVDPHAVAPLMLS